MSFRIHSAGQVPMLTRDQRLLRFLRGNTVLSIALLLFGTFAVSGAGNTLSPVGIIPVDRRVDWQPGVRGGIPRRTKTFCDVRLKIPGSTNLAYGDGIHDDYPALFDAINLCPPNQVVYLPKGTYRVESRLFFPKKSDFTLRGDGPGQTILQAAMTNHQSAFLLFGRSEWMPGNQGHVVPLLSGGSRDSTNIVVADTTGISKGMLIQISQLNDDVYVTSIAAGGVGKSYDLEHNGTRNLQQIVKVGSISGRSVSFWPPLGATFTKSLVPTVTRLVSSVKQIGLEDFTIENVASNKYHVFFDTAENCWIKNVESAWADHWNFVFYQSFQCEVRECYIHEARRYTVNGGYGIEVQLSNGILIENNILWHLHSPLIICAGTTRSVIGYNYVYQTFYSDPTFQTGGLIACHGAYPSLNLWEGNIGNRLQADFYWGSCGPQTIFRNWFTGTDPDVTQNRIAVSLDSHSLSNNVVGNVLGSPGLKWAYDETNAIKFSYLENVIYRLGYPNIGNNNYDSISSQPRITDLDARVSATLLRHGNYDYATESVVWDPTILQTNLPPSLYLTNKPAWWGSSHWPAIGPDQVPMTGKIPSQTRFESIMLRQSKGAPSPAGVP